MRGTRTACKTRCRRERARAARRASSPQSSLARARTAGPVSSPRKVDGATSTSGLFASRFVFHALCQVRKKARRPTKATLTGVGTGAPSRLYVVKTIVLVPLVDVPPVLHRGHGHRGLDGLILKG